MIGGHDFFFLLGIMYITTGLVILGKIETDIEVCVQGSHLSFPFYHF